MRRLIVELLLFHISIISSFAAVVYNPVNEDLLNAKTGSERYWSLYRSHLKAKEEGAQIVYSGIDTLRIEIPNIALPIPLANNVDFGGVVFIVRNQTQNMSLFELSDGLQKILVKKKVVDSGDYRRYRQLKYGIRLVLLKDEKPWVKQRRGYQYGHYREDVVLLKDGIAENSTIFSYNNRHTEVSSQYCVVNSQKKTIENVKFVRDGSCSFITNLIKLANQYNVEIKNVEIYTPPHSTLTKDYAILVANSYGITFDNIRIDGTYSQIDKSGYGISMNNVCNIRFNNLVGRANWGIFGCNNVSTISLTNCDINRFDVHCYGKDIYCENCTFRDLYNQFSSMNGSIIFDNCSFIDFVPCLFETTYNAYTEFNLVFQKCKIWVSKDKDYLIDARGLAGIEILARPELRFQKYPKVFIDNLTIYINDSITSFSVYRKGGNILNQQLTKAVPGLMKFENVKIKN